MASEKLYTGLVLEDDYLKVARISVSRKKATLVKLDRFKLITPIVRINASAEGVGFAFDQETAGAESVFDLGTEAESGEEATGDFDLDAEFEQEPAESGFDELDMASEAAGDLAANNDALFNNLISSFGTKKVSFTLNIPAGNCIFQILQDADFNKIKKKDLQVIVDERLETVYNRRINEDFYSYSKREDGALFLASTDEEPYLLRLAERSKDLFSGKIFIDEVLPDEAILIGLLRANYNPAPESISAVVQYGETYCRIMFMRGGDLIVAPPVITEGSASKKFLNTVFSKILFQLDTGEIPNLDNIILCNNSLGSESIEFLLERFPDVSISEFKFDPDLLDTGEVKPILVDSFTTAIGAAWVSAGYQSDNFPKLSFIPNTIKERQKVFKLQWHGVLLLLLIFLTPVVFNFYYQSNRAAISELEESLRQVSAQAASLEPAVAQYNQTTQDLSAIQNRLELLDELSEGALKWSVNLDIINKGFENLGSVWLTSLSADAQNQSIEIDGFSVYKNRVPMLADIFSSSVLQDVSRSEIREKEVFSYHYTIKKIVSDENVYNTESTKNLKKILGRE